MDRDLGRFAVPAALRSAGAQVEVRAALKGARVAAFVLTAKGLTGPENGAALANALPRMLRYLVGNRPPFIAAVSAGARVTMLYRGHKPRSRTPKRKRRTR